MRWHAWYYDAKRQMWIRAGVAATLRESSAILARDRPGLPNLYYAHTAGQVPDWKPRLDR